MKNPKTILVAVELRVTHLDIFGQIVKLNEPKNLLASEQEYTFALGDKLTIVVEQMPTVEELAPRIIDSKISLRTEERDE